MNRREFFRLLLGTGTAGAVSLWLLPAALGARAAPQRRMNSHVAGVPYRLGFDTGIADVFFPGQRLIPILEPGNRHDANAVALYTGELKVGYLARRDNTAPAAALREGKSVNVRVREVRVADPWEGVRIEVRWAQ